MDIILFVSVFLGGAIFYSLLRPLVKSLVRRFKERAPIIKKYWKFVIPLLVATAVAYVIVALYFYNEINFSLVGQISGLLLAVFAGYIAFSEFGESRFDKLEDTGMQAYKRNEYNSAKIKLEEAHSIKPKEPMVLGNLLELYTILGMNEKFDNKIDLYKKITIEKSDELTYFYLLALRHLMNENIKDARVYIKHSVAFVAEHPDVRETFSWRDDELRGSDAYKHLTGGTRKIIDNHFKYLKRDLEKADETKFTKGNYELA